MAIAPIATTFPVFASSSQNVSLKPDNFERLQQQILSSPHLLIITKRQRPPLAQRRSEGRILPLN
jgi:hypothetical protein